MPTQILIINSIHGMSLREKSQKSFGHVAHP
jgi:hypothetical protein